MEATCACACVTTLVCMTMVARFSDNVKQGAREAEPLNSIAHMARHRFGARGNALTFPLPLEELFLALQSHASEVNSELPLQLPRTGHELGQIARVLLKTNKEGATSEQEIKGLIHQAVVRREAGKEWGNEGGRQLPRGSKFISSPQYTTCRYTVYILFGSYQATFLPTLVHMAHTGHAGSYLCTRVGGGGPHHGHAPPGASFICQFGHGSGTAPRCCTTGRRDTARGLEGDHRC